MKARLVKLGLTLFVIFAPLALAGGLVVILDDQALTPYVSEPFEVGFTILSMHDGLPVESSERPRVVATHTTSKETVSATAEPTGSQGHYQVTLVFPAEGQWNWSVLPFGEAGDYPASLLSPLQVNAKLDTTAIARGEALFLNKGCVSCHVNTRVQGNTVTTSAPNLTAYSNDAEFLRHWLADPKAVRPTTAMFNLHLSEQEIEDLIAFLNAPR
jgi:cytochrome c2